MKKLFDYMANLIKVNERKKLVEGAVLIVILGIVILIAGDWLFERKEKPQAENEPWKKQAEETVAVSAGTEENAKLEKQAADILSQIEGAGKVNVMITYMFGKELFPAFDTKTNKNGTEEKDTGGGTRNLDQTEEEKKIAYEEQQGGVKKPVILKEKMPEVKGVVVVADGAGDAVVKEKLSKAVQVLLDVPIHRIQVFERESK